MSPAPPWKRTLFAIGAAELLAVAGFSTSTPIIPLFLQDMGVSDPVRLKFLTGLLQALPSLSLVFFSPIWGSLADSYGRKPMLLRAMFGGMVVMLLQGLVTAPWQLLVLRTLQGCITGTIAAATILVASVAPREEVGYSLGLLQMAIFLGASIGPLIGGVIADLVGRRVNFFVTSILLLAAGIIVARFADIPKYLVAYEFSEPHDGGQWSAQLTADIGKEQRLALIGLLRPVFGGRELRIHSL
jgi:MFS transporter, DHA1 family, multidrug resistance protein